MNTHNRFSCMERSRSLLIKAIAFLITFLLLSLTSPQVEAQSARVCDPQVYHGIRHCTDDNGDTNLILVDLNNPHVRVQTVLPINPISGEECNSVNANNHPNPDSRDITSNCSYPYPFETVKDMLERYIAGFRVSGYYADLDPVALINTDYFGSDGNHGAQGLAVRNGDRLDGDAHNDDDNGDYHGSTAPSLAFSPLNAARIGIPLSEEFINDHTSDFYFNAVGGGPVIVGGVYYGNAACRSGVYPGLTCSHAVDPQGQSAAGITSDGRLILITAKKDATGIADYLTYNHQVHTAIKFDGGGSASMAWVDNTGTVQDYYPKPDPLRPRPVAEGLLIFSKKIQPTSTVDVSLIIDSSGSMTVNDPGNKRLDAARAYLTASLSGDFVGVVDFDGTVRLASPLLQLPENKTTLINAINTINSSGGTNIGIGVQEGCNALINSPSLNTVKAAILLTDGQGSFLGQDSCFADRGWPIYTFGFGSANDPLLQQIALNTGGEFARLPTEDLVCEFQRVRSKIAGVEPGPCTSFRIGPLEITIFIVPVPPGQRQVTFSSSWVGSDVEMTLTSPSGRVIDRDTIAPDIIHDLGSTFEVYTILNPEPGDWEAIFLGADVPLEGEEVVFSFTSIPAAEQPPSLIVPAQQHVQYSDDLSFNISATDPDDPSNSLVFSAVGLPDGLSLTDNLDGTAIITGTVQSAPGMFNVEITVTDPDGLTDIETVPIMVSQEDARGTYTGPMLVSTPCEDCSEATVPLRTTIQDITAVPGDPAHDPNPGDITNATVAFVDRENSDAVLCTADVIPFDPADPTVGTATCNWVTDIGNNDGVDFSIGIVVDGYYTRNISEDDTIVVVSKPGSNFITGGGYLVNQSSAGMFAGDEGLKTNFGFNIKFNKKLTNLLGRVTIIVRKDGRNYQIKSNRLSSLVVVPFDENNPNSGTAELFGKANIEDVTDPDNPISIEGNATLQMVMKDNGEPGSDDLIAITLWSKNNDLLFSSNWNGIETVGQILDGGNLKVH